MTCDLCGTPEKTVSALSCNLVQLGAVTALRAFAMGGLTAENMSSLKDVPKPASSTHRSRLKPSFVLACLIGAWSSISARIDQT